MAQSEFVGVDACPYGWFSVGFSGDGAYEMIPFPTFRELLNHYHEAQLILVDIPIGLSANAEERVCDAQARGVLDAEHGLNWSVFRAPTRAATEFLANNPDERNGANEIERQITGEPLSNETYAIMPKIIQVDQVLRDRETNAVPQVREVHPEILFRALNRNTPMRRVTKSSKEGITARVRVLQRRCGETREILKEIWPTVLDSYLSDDGVVVHLDDVIDALAAAVTAKNGYPDKLQTWPTKPPQDSNGLPMEMVYWIPQGG